MSDHPVVEHDEWLEMRKELLAKEKELTRRRDELSRLRRALPWEAVDKEYVFDGRDGSVTLADLFVGRSQLVVYHFMFPPEWDEGCKHCSFWADSFDPNVVHLSALDVSFAAISRAPIEKLVAYRERMGWSFAWVSSGASGFNYDYGVSFEPGVLDEPVFNYATLLPGMSDREGVSVFARDDAGRVFHTYSSYGRGIDMLNAGYHYLDLVPRGRQEDDRPNQWWVHRHDEYGG